MKMLERRYDGEPIQYIVGETEFYGLPFRVTPDVLIPRPETEHLVEKVLVLSARFQSPRIVDVGTGSGAIAVALAHHLPNATITAIDLTAGTLTIARQNAALNGVSHRISFLEGDLLSPAAGQHFDIVVSNPPYVPLDRPQLPRRRGARPRASPGTVCRRPMASTSIDDSFFRKLRVRPRRFRGTRNWIRAVAGYRITAGGIRF